MIGSQTTAGIPERLDGFRLKVSFLYLQTQKENVEHSGFWPKKCDSVDDHDQIRLGYLRCRPFG